MSKSIKRFPDDYADLYYEVVDDETPAEMKKKQKLKERRLAKFEKMWKQEDDIVS